MTYRPLFDDEPPPLNELDKIEWQDCSRRARPDWTEEQFEEYWQGFLEFKRKKELH